MSKLLFISALVLLSASCNKVNKPQFRQTVQEDQDYYDDGYYPGDDEYIEWAGPGWYWGIYISNENDYWNHYHNHYHGHGGGHDHGHGHGGGGGGGHGGGGHR